MKALLVVTAAIEAVAGLALALQPPVPVSILLGTTLDSPGAMVIARVAGAALLSLALACWLARHDGPGRAAAGLIAAMTFYNLVVAATLSYAGLGLGLSGVGLWPAVLLHMAMAVWCGVHLRIRT